MKIKYTELLIITKSNTEQDEMKLAQRNLHNEEFYKFLSSLNILICKKTLRDTLGNLGIDWRAELRIVSGKCGV